MKVAGTAPKVPDRAVGGGLYRVQVLDRMLSILDVLAQSDSDLGPSELGERLSLHRSTTHRLATALIERRYLTLVPGRGYQLGPKLLELGFQALNVLSELAGQLRVKKARPGQHIERLLKAIQLVGVALRLLGKGFGSRDQKIKLLFRQEAQGAEAMFLDECKGQRTERLGFPDAQSKKEVVVGARLVLRHARAS